MFNKISNRLRAGASMKARASRRRQVGSAIYQVMFGILVSTAFVYVAVTQYQDAMKKSRIDTATQEVIQIISTSQRMYGYKNQYAEVTTGIAVSGGVVPASRRVAGTDTAQNNYNGMIEFSPSTINTPNDALSIVYHNVLGEDCQQLVQNTEILARQMRVGSSVVKSTDSPISLAGTSTACNVAGNVSIHWIIDRG